ncbi:hypothetical protein M9H77_25068 [Catharanthus roseus]|uniref:Uncharacterized protein n=1 Tax=Catharanthus roseus TaxID=4058 RepID=A0ACC0A5X9_CATRO|nr:hypothetical protein M9H77_25068 [Catharanthus roseus]
MTLSGADRRGRIPSGARGQLKEGEKGGRLVAGRGDAEREHRPGLIWSGDHETCFTDLQCRRFERNLFQCYSTTPVKKILKYRDMNSNLWNVRMTMRVPSYYEVHRMFYFNLYSMNNDEEMCYLWTIPPHIAMEVIHILVKFEHIQQQSIPIPHGTNTTTLPEHITAVTQMVFDELSMLYSTVNNDNDEVNGSDGDDAVSSQSESDDDNDPEEGEFQTSQNPTNPINPVTENIVP